MLHPMITYKVLPYPSLRPRKEIMFDTETLGKRAGCALLSIGAVAFDPWGLYDGKHQAISLENQFFAKISLESCKAAGLFVDPSTKEWWDTQSPEAIENAFGGTVPLRDALEGFSEWLFDVCGKTPDGDAACNVWSHGEDFDQPIVNHAYEILGLKKPWPYNGGRDTRTALDMGGVAYKGVSHMAVKDSLDQALAVRRSFSNLGLTAALSDTANEPKPEPFGTYVERSDGSTEFRRTGEVHTPTAQAYTFWTLYSGHPPAREIVQPIKPLADSAEVAPIPEISRSSARLSPAQKAVLRHCLDWSAAFEVAERRNDDGASTNWWRTQDILRALAARGLVRYGEASATYKITDKGRAEIGLSPATSSIEE